MRCHYDVLGIQLNADKSQIRKAYKTQALKHHPDKNPDRCLAATEEFKLIQRAYDVLSDPEKKARYDQQRDTLLRAYKPPPTQTSQPAKRFYSEAMAETMAHKKMAAEQDVFTYVGEDALSADALLPSKAYINEGIAEIKVFKCPEDFSKEEPHENHKNEVEGRLKKEFDQMVKWNPQITLENLKVMAQKNNFTSGKWLLAVPWDQADEQWDILKRALITGKLPAGVRCVRVKGRDERESNPHSRVNGGRVSNAMMSIMTEDWTDKSATMDIGRKVL